MRKDLNKAEELFKRFLGEYSESKYNIFVYMNLGDICTNLGKYDQAAMNYMKIPEVSENVELIQKAYLFAANAYLMGENYNDSETLFKSLIDNPEIVINIDTAFIGLFSALYRGEKFDEVIDAVTKLETKIVDPEIKAHSLFLKGNGFYRKNQFEEAEKVFNAVHDQYPEKEFGRKSRLSQCWMLNKLEKYSECVSIVEDFMANYEEGLDEVLYLKGKSLIALGKNELGKETYEEFLKSYTDSFYYDEVLYEIGWICEMLGENQRAVDVFTEFWERNKDKKSDPRVEMAFVKIGEMNIKLKKYKEAEEIYLKFLDIYKESKIGKNVLYQLGMI